MRKRQLALVGVLLGGACLWLLTQRDGKQESPPGSVVDESPTLPKPELAARRENRQAVAPSETAAPSAASEESTLFRVHDGHKTAIAGATLSQPSAPDAHVLTDAYGVARLVLRQAMSGSTYADVRIEAPGYVDVQRTLALDTREVSVRLDRPVSLVGRVTLSSGDEPGAGMVALAWPFELTRIPPESEYVELLNASRKPGPRDRVRIGVVDPDGRFEIPGVDPSTHVYVIAGGPGRLTQVLELASPGVQDVSLVAMHIYAAIVSFQERNGEPLRLSPSLRASRRSSFWSESSEAEALELSILGALLTGLPQESTRDEPDSRRVCLFSSTSKEPEIGPCAMEWRVPGYETESLRFQATAVELDATHVTVHVRRQARARGAIELVPEGCSAMLVAAQRDAARFAVDTSKGLLTLQGGAGEPKMMFGFELRLDGAVRIEDIPAGQYTVRVNTMKQHVPIPPLDEPGHPLEVKADETTRWTLNFEDFGAVVVELFDGPSNADYHGWARWTLADGEPVRHEDGEIVLEAADPLTFVRGPYLTGLVPAGTYTLRGHAPPWSAPADEGGYLTIQVRPQEVKRLRIALAGP